MTRADAEAIAGAHLEPYRRRTYEELLKLLEDRESFEGTTANGEAYYGKVYAIWDGRAHHNLRIWSDVNWGGWSDFRPVTVTFIMAPDGSFVGD